MELSLTLVVSYITADSTHHSYYGIYLLGGPNHDRLGFRYWKHPGPFTQFNGISGAKGRFLGFFSVLTLAAFSYIGTEIVAVSTFWVLFGRTPFHCINTRSLPEKLKILDATSQRPSSEYTFVSHPAYYAYIYIYFDPRYSSLLYRWSYCHWSFGSVK